MGRKKKIARDITITGIADKGRGVGRDPDGMVYFIEGAVPGDIVNVQITKRKTSHRFGFVVDYARYSERRVKPFCAHFGDCGGCKWQNMSYLDQLMFKEIQVTEVFQRMAGLEIAEQLPIIGAEKQRFYRNKLEYSFSNKRWIPREILDSGEPVNFNNGLGFHKAGAFDKVVDIQQCYLQEDTSNRIRNYMRTLADQMELTYYDPRKHSGFLRNMILRNNRRGEWMVIMIFGADDKKVIKAVLSQLHAAFHEITSLYWAVNTNFNDNAYALDYSKFSGEEGLEERLGHIVYSIGPKSFFQTNTYQAEVLYDIVHHFAELKGTEIVYDLYSGIGSIALFIAGQCQKVIGVEEIDEAVMDAKRNCALNNIGNASFFSGDVKVVVDEPFIEENGTPDVVIVDPPRAGLHKHVVQTIRKIQAPKVIYVSCNPSTQARDITLLSDVYSISKVQPVDMFPHTHHIENVVLLLKK